MNAIPLPRLPAAIRFALTGSGHSRQRPTAQNDDANPEENPWMQKEDVASAWAISGLTLAALASLVVLAVIG